MDTILIFNTISTFNNVMGVAAVEVRRSCRRLLVITEGKNGILNLAAKMNGSVHIAKV